AGDEEGGGAEHAVQGEEGEVAGDGGYALEEGGGGAAEARAGDRGGGAACLHREAADRQLEALSLGIEAGGAGGVDQVVAMADVGEERRHRELRIGTHVEGGGARSGEVAPARSATAAAGGTGSGAVDLPPGEQRLPEEALLDQHRLAAGHPLAVNRALEGAAGQPAVVDDGEA